MAKRKNQRPESDGEAPQITWRYSRKTRRISINLALSAANAMHRSLLGTDAAKDLWFALDQALGKTPGRDRPLRKWFKEWAATAYLYVGEQYTSHKPPALPLRRAERECRARVADWPVYDFRDRRRLLSAVLARSAFRQEWERLGLGDPLAKPDQTAEGFYRKHILPGLPAAKRNRQRREVIAALLAEDVPTRYWWRVDPLDLP